MTALKAPEMTEKAWQKVVTDLATTLGWRVNHTFSSTTNGSRWLTTTTIKGMPDLLAWHEQKRKLIFIELKRESGRLTSEQREVLRSLMAAGQECHVWRPSDLERVREVLS